MIVGLLLAAGGARRFGSQKLVAVFRGQPLVRHAADALARASDLLIVVVGSEARAVRDAVGDQADAVVENAEWATGLASSVRCGIVALPRETEAVLIGLGDQPGVDPAIGRAVVARWRETNASIVAPRFRDGRGHPVLFARAVFDELLMLEGDVGAKPVIERLPERVSEVFVDDEMPRDIDTPLELHEDEAG